MTGRDWYPLVLVLLLAVAVPLGLSRVRRLQIPVVVGELVAGMIFGRTGFDIIPQTGLLSFFSLFGLSYLMFLSGMELDLGVFHGGRQRGRMGTSLAVYVGVLALSVLAALYLERLGMVHSGLLVGFIIGSTALTVVVPVLKERGILQTDYGQVVLTAAILLDFLSMLLVTVEVSLRAGAAWRLILGVGVFLLAAVLLRLAPALRQLWRRTESQVAQVGVRGAFGLIVLFLALSQLIGIEAVLGSFLAGVIAAAIAGRESEEVRRTLDGIGYGFFVPIFFIQVGSSLNLRGFLGNPHGITLSLLLLVAASAASLLPGLLLRFAMPWRSALSGALILSTRLTVTIAGATVAYEARAITSGTMIAIVLMSIVSSLLWPALAQRLMPSPPRERSGVIIQGGSTWSSLAAAHLRERGEEVRWIGDPDDAPAGVHVLRLREGTGIAERLAAAHAETAAALLALSTDLSFNAELCRTAQQRFGLPRTVAIANEAEMDGLREEGIGCFRPEAAPLVVLEAMARAPLVLEMLSGGVGGAEIRTLRVDAAAVDGQTLRELDLPRELLLIGLERDGERLLPRGDTRVMRGDRVTALGTQGELARLALLLGGHGNGLPEA
jgi:Kef-type K+ transport system membrane component KefB/Trk K+ transport system NAD-binding subunit